MRQKVLISFFIVLVSLIYGLPNIILTAKLGEDYNPLVITSLSPIARDEAFAYAPFVNHILKGNFFVRDTYVYEYENFPTPYIGETAPALVFAFLSKLTGSIRNAFITADFIFPPIIFLMLYFVSRKLIENHFYAMAISFLAVIARDFIAVIPYPHETLQYLTVAENQNFFLYFSRAFHPQLTFIFFISSFLLSVEVVSRPNRKLSIILMGIISGILFYSYIFYWTYFFVFLTFVILFYAFKKNLDVIKALVFALIIALIIGSIYFINIFQFFGLDFYQDFVTKTSRLFLPLPVTLLRYLGILLLFFLIVPKKNHSFYSQKNFVYLMFMFLLTGVLIAPLSKFVLGSDLEVFHYLRRALMPFATLAFLIVLYCLVWQRKILINALTLAILTITLLVGIKTQVLASEKVLNYQVIDHDREALFSWFKKNTPPNSVIASLNLTLNSLIPAFTSNRIYFPPTDRTITPTYEGVERYSILANILGIDSSWQKQNLDNTISYMFLFQAYHPTDETIGMDLNSPRRIWAEQEIDKLSNGKWKDILGKYKLDYVIVSPDELPIANPHLQLLEPITSIGEYIIFKSKLRNE